jgi:hypothetical protein
MPSTWKKWKERTRVSGTLYSRKRTDKVPRKHIFIVVRLNRSRSPTVRLDVIKCRIKRPCLQTYGKAIFHRTLETGNALRLHEGKLQRHLNLAPGKTPGFLQPGFYRLPDHTTSVMWMGWQSVFCEAEGFLQIPMVDYFK